MMKKQMIALCAALALSLTVRAQAAEGIAERIGERIDQAVGDVREEAKDVAGQLREGYQKARDAINRMGVAGRVYARIRWDKGLVGADVDVDVNQGGVAVLRGVVPSEPAKQKAEALAGDTVGVNSVVNQLKIVAAPQ